MSLTNPIYEASMAQHATKDHQLEPLTKATEQYLEANLGNLIEILPSDIYDKVMFKVEKALIETVMRYAQDNQSQVARILGISRGTLLKRLKRYRLINEG